MLVLWARSKPFECPCFVPRTISRKTCSKSNIVSMTICPKEKNSLASIFNPWIRSLCGGWGRAYTELNFKKSAICWRCFSLFNSFKISYIVHFWSRKINMYGWPFHISTFIFCSVWTWYGFFSLYLHEEKNALFYPFLAHWAVGAFNGNRPLDGCRRLVFYLLQMAFRCKCGQRITRPHTFLRKQQPTPSELQQNV